MEGTGVPAEFPRVHLMNRGELIMHIGSRLVGSDVTEFLAGSKERKIRLLHGPITIELTAVQVDAGMFIRASLTDPRRQVGQVHIISPTELL